MTIQNTSVVHRVRRQRIKRALVMAMAFVFIYIAGYTGFTLANSSLFDIATITVKGNRTVSREEIIAISGARIGANVLRLSRDHAGRSLMAHPYIQDAKVSWVFPNRVSITVSERLPVALVRTEDRCLVLDGSGFCLTEENSMPAAYEGLPLILGGVHAAALKPGDQTKDKGILAALTLIDRLDPFFMENIKAFDAPSGEKLAVINRDGLRVLFGLPEDLDRKLQNYEELLIKNAQRCNTDTLNYVDLRYDTQITLSWK